jgi:hypothetical protein
LPAEAQLATGKTMPKSPKSKSRGNKANEEAMLARADAVLARLSQPIEPAKKDITHKPTSVVNNTLNRVYDNLPHRHRRRRRRPMLLRERKRVKHQAARDRLPQRVKNQQSPTGAIDSCGDLNYNKNALQKFFFKRCVLLCPGWPCSA